ncbi:MAG: DUF177 domain-containing protein [Pyrinomonadaceae bacterium]
MMLIEADNLGAAPKKFDLLISPESIELERDDVDIKGNISLRCDASANAASLDVKGVIAFAADFACSRCVKAVPQSFLFDFNVEYVAPEDFPSDREKELIEADLERDVLSGNSIDLAALVREQVLLNLPERLICEEACKGLCSSCGENKNLAECECSKTEGDPRWSALKKLR